MTTISTCKDSAASRPPAAILHNMSSRPSAKIGHEGRHACNVVRVALAGFSSEKAAAVREWCWLFAVPFEDDVQGLEQLRLIVAQSPADLASLPVMAPVVAPTKAVFRPGLSDDPHMALSVLCRCSDKVFIRDKSPTVTLANLTRDIALVLPLLPGETKP